MKCSKYPRKGSRVVYLQSKVFAHPLSQNLLGQVRPEGQQSLEDSCLYFDYLKSQADLVGRLISGSLRPYKCTYSVFPALQERHSWGT